MISLLVMLGKTITIISRLLNLGHGSTWPGHIALSVNKNFIKEIIKSNPKFKIILIAGTNGKTTTGKLIQTILEKSKYKVFQNEAGANLLNGIASSLLMHTDMSSSIDYDYAIFEVDEATLPLILKEISPDYLILLNLFRDQLDRYGEVNTIARKWGDTIQHVLPKTKLILNADDPQVAYLGTNERHSGKRSSALQNERIQNLHSAERLWTGQSDGNEILYFGLNDKRLDINKHQHAIDSTYCPNCDSKLFYNTIYYSHLGDWECKNCKLKRPNLDISNIEYYPISGTYNRYDTLAAVLLAKQLRIQQKNINTALHEFTPAFGRQEVLNVTGKKVQIFLSKNPTSFNESLRTIADLGARNVLFVLNDRIPDGRDVSWIWDVDTEEYAKNFNSVVVSGDRAYDMGLRLKYSYSSEFSISNFQFSMKTSRLAAKRANLKFQIQPNLKSAINKALKLASQNNVLYILPTYSAMLEVRKILTGKKIL